ncbi:uncharacterized protein LOC131876911 [Tigriopus californicus]|uniref:uncharacterized protein LOC131876911 n=1 Tax=Tigriopus californicus TaxID=6832 RepID=UPI0027DA2B9F|nr:uncharacterized protein LOC131876911 [Tigriopus californicus]
MDLVAVLSTGVDVWELRVKGQLENETWSNIGVRWEVHSNDPTLPYSERGGLELFVNAMKVGHSVLPMERPGVNETANDLGSWAEGRVLTPDGTWKGGPMDAPIILIGCHRNSDDLTFRYFRGQSVAFDELSIWTRKLEINRTHDESLYFLGGYMAQFEDVSSEEWFEMMDKVDLEVPSQAAAAGFVVEKYATENSSLETGALNADNLTDWTTSISFESNFPRTLQQKKDFIAQKKAFSVSAKLIGKANVKINERAKYLSRRFTILPVVSSPLTDSQQNVDGWKSVQLDPSEEGSSRLVRAMDNFVLTFMGSANIDHDEDYPPFYDYELSDMTIHSKAPGYTMSASKIKPNKFQKYGDRLQINGFYTSHPVYPDPLWNEVDETIEIPTKIPFVNQTYCEEKPFTLLTTVYHGYGKMAPLRRNPGTVTPKAFKIDSKPISVKIRVNPDPNTDNMTKRFDTDCAIDEDAMKYSPVKLRFYHTDFMTSKRKLLWFDNELKTNIELRRCVVYNEKFGIYGGWDASQCTTVITEQSSTVCECGTFGTFALIAEMVEDPFVEAEDNWLVVMKYIGYTTSIVFFLIFIIVVILSSRLWDMFHLMRLNAAICMLLAHISMFLAEIPEIREDRKLNVIFSILQQYWILASGGFLCSETLATFQAVTAGIIGGKLMSYVPIVYGLPFINIGTTIYIYADDYGRDPRAFIGWENETKWVFFYLQWPLNIVAAFLSLVLLINLATPQTRKDSVMETLTVQAQGLAVTVFIYAATWGFAYPAFMHFPDKEWANFYPIFALLNSWLGLFFFSFMGIGSNKFRRNLMGQYKQKSALMVGYMVPDKEDEFDVMDETEHTDGGQESPSSDDIEPGDGSRTLAALLQLPSDIDDIPDGDYGDGGGDGNDGGDGE